MGNTHTYRLGIDVGGTFTDLALLDTNSHVLHFEKVLTTPSDPSLGVLKGVEQILGTQADSRAAVEVAIHATTLVSNAVIEHKGSHVALLTTKGFKDTLRLGRIFRYDIYDSNLTYPRPLVRRRDCIEVQERMSAKGIPVIPLTPAEVARVIDVLKRHHYVAVAICLLNSYCCDSHEGMLSEAIRSAMPGVYVSVSSELLPQIGEYERTCATAMNAFVQPLINAYLDRLDEGLVKVNGPTKLYLMSSGGGLISTNIAKQQPIQLLESGPVAGVLGAVTAARSIDQVNVLSFDMGGTTAKASVIKRGSPQYTREFEVARVQRLTKGSGFPIRLPSVDMLEIGAGGGSIAWVDEMGLIRVGPQSAGADPGPACYGRGGNDATVTDANLLLGYLNPSYFLGGAMSLYLDIAQAVMGRLGKEVGLSTTDAAWGVHEIVSKNMANALRTHAIEKGIDYRSYSLFAFGGAGPIHARRIASVLSIKTIIIPWATGVFSALGLLTAAPRFDVVRTFPARFEDIDFDRVRAIYGKMDMQLLSYFNDLLRGGEKPIITHSADCRYVGQAHTVEVTLTPSMEAGDLQAFRGAFEREYIDRYTWALSDRSIEAVNWRAALLAERPQLNSERTENAGPARQEPEPRPIYVDKEHGFCRVPVYDRYLLAPGTELMGPLVIEERESTTIAGPGDVVRVDSRLNLILRIEE